MTVACGAKKDSAADAANAGISTTAEEDKLSDSLTKSIGSSDDAGKVETVYVNADASGAANDIIVSEWLKNAGATAELADKTELKDIVNKFAIFNTTPQGINPTIANIQPQPVNYNPVPTITNEPEIVNAEEFVEEQPMSIKDIHYQSILDALKRNNYNRKKAAQELGISERTIYRKLKQNGFKKE